MEQAEDQRVSNYEYEDESEEVIDDVVTSEELQEEIAEEMNQQAYDEEDIPVEESADVEEVEE